MRAAARSIKIEYYFFDKLGRLFFKRIAVFFWEDSEWGAVQHI